MYSLTGDTRSLPNVAAGAAGDWLQRVLALLDAAAGQLQHEQAAQGALLQATSLLRERIGPRAVAEGHDGREQLLAWQARKVLDYIDAHLAARVRVSDLCTVVQRSEAHFSRSFKRTFGMTPHAFVVRRRVDLAARYMLQTDSRLSDIAVRCGFVDQAHLCKHFRQVTGETPAAWRRLRRSPHAAVERVA